MKHPVLLLIDAFVELYPDEEYHFGHIVLSDENVDDHAIDYCLNETSIGNHNPVTVKFLEFLRSIPEDDRMDWDDSE